MELSIFITLVVYIAFAVLANFLKVVDKIFVIYS